MGFRYIGSKDKLAEIIISEIEELHISADRVIDLMAGTGQLSRSLRQNGYKVTAVDVMTYSYHHLNVFLRLNSAPAFDGLKIQLPNSPGQPHLFDNTRYSSLLTYLGGLDPMCGYFFNEFAPLGRPKNSIHPRKYFTAENAGRIDAMRARIAELKKEGELTELEHSLLLHDLIMAVNDVANIAGTYGHYLSKFVGRALEPILLKPTEFLERDDTSEHLVYRAYAEEIAPSLYGDVCYVDPPYIKRQYAANYHILETLAREDFPEAVGVSGLRPWRDQYSDFCSKLKIHGAFDRIITTINCDHFLISYSEDGLIPINDLVSFLRGYGDVKLKSIKYKRFKSNENNKGGSLDEFLIHLRRRLRPSSV